MSRGALLKIGDEAVEVLRKQDQIALTEMVVWQEVDRLITKRLRVPTYATWKRRRIKMLEQYQKPEHWGIDPNAMLVRALSNSSDRHVLVAGAEREGPALYLAARGCAVTAVEPAVDAVERVVRAAEAAGLTERVRGYCADLGGWAPDVALHGVVCSPTAFAGLTMHDCTQKERLCDVSVGHRRRGSRRRFFLSPLLAKTYKYIRAGTRCAIERGDPSRSVRRCRTHTRGGGSPTMRLKESVLVLQQREPMGIVIADGGPGDRPSRFAAFVWGPVPDDELRETERTKELTSAS